MVLGRYCWGCPSTAGYCWCTTTTSTTAGPSGNACFFTVAMHPAAEADRDFQRMLRDFEKAATRSQLAQRAAATRARLMKPPVERVLAPIEVLNAGMQLRKLRAPTGLARGRA